MMISNDTVWVLVALVATYIVAANIYYRRKWRSMSPIEQKEFLDGLERDLRIW